MALVEEVTLALDLRRKKTEQENSDDNKRQPKLYVLYNADIAEYKLDGRQNVGRPSSGSTPEILLADEHVSRHHGWFETTGAGTSYHAQETVNGIYLKGREIPAGESVVLSDGDELRIPIDNENDAVLVYIVSEEREKMWQSLERASRDELTGLPNRKSYTAWFKKNAMGGGLNDACLFILDIDHFKGINDTYGHEVGDHALMRMADELRTAMVDDYHAGRWGGDEFVGVIEGTAQQAYEVMKKMSDRICADKIDDLFTMTISAGIVEIGRMPEEERNIHRLIEFADEALYEAKEGGRNCIHICKIS